ncbi:MAG: FAD-dependent oxidoreductase, partial [Flavobacteriales bacterium]
TLGVDVDIFEAKDKPSGLTVFGTAPYKITNEAALKEVKYLQDQLKFNIHYNSPVAPDDLKSLEKEYDAIFIGVGIGPTAETNIPGEDKEGVVGAVEFIEELRMKHHKVDVPDRVVVIGGGNTAIDAASETARMGAEKVRLLYRRKKEDKGGYDFEYEYALKAGVEGVFNVQPLEILGDDKVEGIKVIKTKEKNEALEYIDGSEYEIPCDMVIRATGQAKVLNLLNAVEELELDEKDRIKVDNETFQTGNPKYYAGGDAINGGAEVVNGAYDGKMAAKAMVENF